jgi:hypothetical protein
LGWTAELQEVDGALERSLDCNESNLIRRAILTYFISSESSDPLCAHVGVSETDTATL